MTEQTNHEKDNGFVDEAAVNAAARQAIQHFDHEALTELFVRELERHFGIPAQFGASFTDNVPTGELRRVMLDYNAGVLDLPERLPMDDARVEKVALLLERVAALRVWICSQQGDTSATDVFNSHPEDEAKLWVLERTAAADYGTDPFYLETADIPSEVTAVLEARVKAFAEKIVDPEPLTAEAIHVTIDLMDQDQLAEGYAAATADATGQDNPLILLGAKMAAERASIDVLRRALHDFTDLAETTGRDVTALRGTPDLKKQAYEILELVSYSALQNMAANGSPEEQESARKHLASRPVPVRLRQSN